MSQLLQSKIDYSSDVHVFPTFGKPHILSVFCWCEPIRDIDEFHVIIHDVSH